MSKIDKINKLINKKKVVVLIEDYTQGFLVTITNGKTFDKISFFIPDKRNLTTLLKVIEGE